MCVLFVFCLLAVVFVWLFVVSFCMLFVCVQLLIVLFCVIVMCAYRVCHVFLACAFRVCFLAFACGCVCQCLFVFVQRWFTTAGLMVMIVYVCVVRLLVRLCVCVYMCA